MYCISDQQIEFILNDIGARGVKMEDLQLNLLDHVCCIIEQQLEDNGNFEQFYATTIRKFYKDELMEIEEETISLLTNKNYYVMKKIMIYSGVFSATALSAGITFKYMHAAGAGVLLTLGIVTASLIFIPLLFALKVKEKQSGKDKLLVGLGTLSAISISMGILFKIQHWPGANMLCVISPAILMLVFLPIYFITGIRNADTKVNTIVTSILMIVGCGLFFSLTITPQTTRLISIRNTQSYLRSEQILKEEQALLEKYKKADTANTTTEALGKKIYATCNELKSYLVETETGHKTVDADFENQNALISDHSAQEMLANDKNVYNKLQELGKIVAEYNAANAKVNLPPIPVASSIIDFSDNKVSYRVIGALNDIIQIQMRVLQNERSVAML